MSTLTLDFGSGTDALTRLLAPDVMAAEILPAPAGLLHSEHLRGKAMLNLDWVVAWLRTVHLLRRCPANDLPLARCVECRTGMQLLSDPKGKPRLTREDLLASKFVGGGSDRPGPHLHELGEAVMANLLQAAGILGLA